jgi:hypothetical protein
MMITEPVSECPKCHRNSLYDWHYVRLVAGTEKNTIQLQDS